MKHGLAEPLVFSVGMEQVGSNIDVMWLRARRIELLKERDQMARLTEQYTGAILLIDQMLEMVKGNDNTNDTGQSTS